MSQPVLGFGFIGSPAVSGPLDLAVTVTNSASNYDGSFPVLGADTFAGKHIDFFLKLVLDSATTNAPVSFGSGGGENDFYISPNLVSEEGYSVYGALAHDGTLTRLATLNTTATASLLDLFYYRELDGIGAILDNVDAHAGDTIYLEIGPS